MPSGIFESPKSVDNIFISGKIEVILEVALLARFMAFGARYLPPIFALDYRFL